MGGAYDWGQRKKTGRFLLAPDHVMNRKGRGMFLKLTENGGLWKKIRSHVGTTVESPVSPATRGIRSRLSDEGVERSVSVCPYCAVGCSTLVYHREGRIIDIEGNPDSPINAGTLCPKGSANFGLHNSPYRWTKVRYRRPHSSEWEDLSLEEALPMIAERVKKTRDETWEERDEAGKRLSRSMAVASIGGATIDNEENYLITKLFHSMGFARITNQARI
jgi:formate dehydrogenase major subunit